MNQAYIFAASATKLSILNGFLKGIHNLPAALYLPLRNCSCKIRAVRFKSNKPSNIGARRLAGAYVHNMLFEISQCILDAGNFHRATVLQGYKNRKFLVVNEFKGIDGLNRKYPVIYGDHGSIRRAEQFSDPLQPLEYCLHFMLAMGRVNHGQRHSFSLAPSRFRRCKHDGTYQSSRRANGSDPVCGHGCVHTRPRGGTVSVVGRCAQADHQSCPSKPGQPSQHKFPCQKEILS